MWIVGWERGDEASASHEAQDIGNLKTVHDDRRACIGNVVDIGCDDTDGGKSGKDI